ncbi:BolA/IbaG family iron-sulfur metabolism protein [Buchnera aphidicola]|uniref:BolA family transcriptional regulator n=1 Tax=Buchnera aphidicola (Lipaphis pseudobrassicae) TaxID=1258543 RepID=A0A4D6Y7T0_9GAMM|nr:BolA/IbaG family iron-sulfur metabolism protein [Buchnera aphidicola]QCI22304.1 BolA family transcriptional regulator [Buchnera aphidicola (Lipaphis pseudobrassicae)]
MILKKINQCLRSELKINFIKIYDDSSFHNYSKKNLTHIRMVIVSNDFLNQTILTRHRVIFAILSKIKKDKIYSITLSTYTSREWEYKKYKKISISKCLKKNDILSNY